MSLAGKELIFSFQTKMIDMVFYLSEGAAGLQKALKRMCKESEEAAQNGYQLLIFSDRNAGPGWVPVR